MKIIEYIVIVAVIWVLGSVLIGALYQLVACLTPFPSIPTKAVLILQSWSLGVLIGSVIILPIWFMTKAYIANEGDSKSCHSVIMQIKDAVLISVIGCIWCLVPILIDMQYNASLFLSISGILLMIVGFWIIVSRTVNKEGPS